MLLVGIYWIGWSVNLKEKKNTRGASMISVGNKKVDLLAEKGPFSFIPL